MSELWRRLLCLFRRGRLSRDLEEKMQFHLDMKLRQNRQAGLAEPEARYAARRQFGNATLLKERSAEMWGWTSVERVGQDPEPPAMGCVAEMIERRSPYGGKFGHNIACSTGIEDWRRCSREVVTVMCQGIASRRDLETNRRLRPLHETPLRLIGCSHWRK